MKFFKKIKILLLALLLPVFCKAEYISYKLVDGQAVAIANEVEHKKIYDILMTYQFPMNTNLSLKLEEKLTNYEMELLNSDEQAFLEYFIQKNVDKNIHLLWIPNILFEHFTINYILQNNKIDGVKNLFEKLRSFRYEFFSDEKLKLIVNLFKSSLCLLEKKEDNDFDCSKIIENLNPVLDEMKKQEISFLHGGYPFESDPVCMKSIGDYYVSSKNLNDKDLFVQTNYLINKELFNFLIQNNYIFEESEKFVSNKLSFNYLNLLINDLSKFIPETTIEDELEAKYWQENAFNDFDNDKYRSVKDRVEFITNVDKHLIPVLSKILSIEFEAYKNNSFILYRGTNGFEDKLDSPVDSIDKNISPEFLSYGSGIYSASMSDKGASPAYYVNDYKFFYALLINKSEYKKNNLSNPDLNIVHIHPYNTIVSLFGLGNWCHPRAKSFVPKETSFNPIKSIISKLITPPIFWNLFTLDIEAKDIARRFSDYYDDNVRFILRKDSESGSWIEQDKLGNDITLEWHKIKSLDDMPLELRKQLIITYVESFGDRIFQILDENFEIKKEYYNQAIDLFKNEPESLKLGIELLKMDRQTRIDFMLKRTENQFDEYFKKSFADEEFAHLIFAKNKDGEMLGFVGFHGYGRSAFKNNTLQLDPVAIIPNAQGRGLARLLIFSILKISPEIQRIVLDTEIWNIHAQDVYKHLGFTQFNLSEFGINDSWSVGFEWNAKV